LNKLTINTLTAGVREFLLISCRRSKSGSWFFVWLL